MESEDEAKAAIAALDGHNIHGSRMTVEVWTFLIIKNIFVVGEFVFWLLFALYGVFLSVEKL